MTLGTLKDAQVRRVAVIDEDPGSTSRYDYADSFEVTTHAPDDRTAEQWTRAALDDAPRAVRIVIHRVWRSVLGFEIGPACSPDHVVGARIRFVDDDRICLDVGGPIMRGVILARRLGPDRFLLTTFVYYLKAGIGRPVWAVAAPLHRAVARYLLVRAARG